MSLACLNLAQSLLTAAAVLAAIPAFAQDASSATPAAAPAASAAPADAAAPAPAAAAPDAAPATAPAAAAPAAAPTAAPKANQSSTSTSGVIGAPPAGKGQVVFFRPSAMSGWAVWFNVRENGAALGKLTNGVYFVTPLDPGTHTFTAATENKDTLKLEIDDGETYYVKGGITMGIMIGEANIAPSDKVAFEKAVGHMKLAPPPAPAKTAAAAK
jgi:hypothetical protein